MRRTLPCLVLLAHVLAGCAHRPADPASHSRTDAQEADWIYAEPVAYKESHDPADIHLMDGRVLGVAYGSVSWEDVAKWLPGRKLSKHGDADGQRATRGIPAHQLASMRIRTFP